MKKNTYNVLVTLLIGLPIGICITLLFFTGSFGGLFAFFVNPAVGFAGGAGMIILGILIILAVPVVIFVYLSTFKKN